MSANFVNQLEDLQRRSLRMASAVEDIFEEAVEAALNVDRNLAERVIQRDEEVDQEEVQIESEVIRLIALFQPMGSDLRRLTTVLKVNNDLERTADCAVNIAERARHLEPDAIRSAIPDLKQMSVLVRRILRESLKAFAMSDLDLAKRVLRSDDTIDAFYGQFIRKIAEHQIFGPNELSVALDVLSIAKNFERIADHCTNIAEDVIYFTTGQIVRHQD